MMQTPIPYIKYVCFTKQKHTSPGHKSRYNLQHDTVCLYTEIVYSRPADEAASSNMRFLCSWDSSSLELSFLTCCSFCIRLSVIFWRSRSVKVSSRFFDTPFRTWSVVLGFEAVLWIKEYETINVASTSHYTCKLSYRSFMQRWSFAGDKLVDSEETNKCSTHTQ